MKNLIFSLVLLVVLVLGMVASTFKGFEVSPYRHCANLFSACENGYDYAIRFEHFSVMFRIVE